MCIEHGVYNEHMACITVQGWQCDVCGYQWLKLSAIPTHCANRKCRSRKWNSGVSVNGKPAVSKAATVGSTPAAPAIEDDGIVHEPEFCQDPGCRECRKLRTVQ